MKYLVLSLLLAVEKTVPLLAQAEQWQHVTVSDSVTVDFPGRPKQITQENQLAYGLYTDGVLYSVAVQPKATDPGTTLAERRKLYSEAVKGATEKARASQITDTIRFVSNGFEGLEVTFLSTLDKLKNPVTMRMVAVNGTFYGLTFSAPPGPAYAADRQHFFASFAPQQHPAPITPAETRTTAYKVGQLMGQVAFYGLILAGILYLVSRSKKKPTT